MAVITNFIKSLNRYIGIDIGFNCAWYQTHNDYDEMYMQRKCSFHEVIDSLCWDGLLAHAVSFPQVCVVCVCLIAQVPIVRQLVHALSELSQTCCVRCLSVVHRQSILSHLKKSKVRPLR